MHTWTAYVGKYIMDDASDKNKCININSKGK